MHLKKGRTVVNVFRLGGAVLMGPRVGEGSSHEKTAIVNEKGLERRAQKDAAPPAWKMLSGGGSTTHLWAATHEEGIGPALRQGGTEKGRGGV